MTEQCVHDDRVKGGVLEAEGSAVPFLEGQIADGARHSLAFRAGQEMVDSYDLGNSQPLCRVLPCPVGPVPHPISNTRAWSGKSIWDE